MKKHFSVCVYLYTIVYDAAVSEAIELIFLRDKLVLGLSFLRSESGAWRHTQSLSSRMQRAARTSLVCHHRTIGRSSDLAWKGHFGCGKVRWRVHFLEDVGHALLGDLLLPHLGELTLGNGRLLIAFLKLFVRQEVLRHDARDLLEVVKHGNSCVLLSRSAFSGFLCGTEDTEVVAAFQSC